MNAKWLLQLGILDVTALNPALYENIFWTDFAKISHSAFGLSSQFKLTIKEKRKFYLSNQPEKKQKAKRLNLQFALIIMEKRGN